MMKKLLLVCAVAVFFFFSGSLADARRGCCSHHGGVCGCLCCDGTSLSAKCSPYYPSCNEQRKVTIPKKQLLSIQKKGKINNNHDPAFAQTYAVERGCKEHIEVISRKDLAREYGINEKFFNPNPKIWLWEKETSQGKGKHVGVLFPSSKALILEAGKEDYKVHSEYHKSTGWINKIQVKRTLLLDAETFKECGENKNNFGRKNNKTNNEDSAIYITVGKFGANLYAHPSHTKGFKKIRKGKKLEVFEERVFSQGGTVKLKNKWYRVKYKKEEGWVSEHSMAEYNQKDWKFRNPGF